MFYLKFVPPRKFFSLVGWKVLMKNVFNMLDLPPTDKDDIYSHSNIET